MADNIDRIIDNVIAAEGGSTATNDPADGGGRTQYGISERANPEAWADGKVTAEEARARLAEIKTNPNHPANPLFKGKISEKERQAALEMKNRLYDAAYPENRQP